MSMGSWIQFRTSQVKFFSGCQTLQTSFWLVGVSPQLPRRDWAMGFSYYSVWHWGWVDWVLGLWLLLSLSLGLGWSMAGWPGHYLRECARLSRHVFAHLNFSLCREYLPLAWASRTVLASSGQGFGRLTITISYHIDHADVAFKSPGSLLLLDSLQDLLCLAWVKLFWFLWGLAL